MNVLLTLLSFLVGAMTIVGFFGMILCDVMMTFDAPGIPRRDLYRSDRHLSDKGIRWKHRFHACICLLIIGLLFIMLFRLRAALSTHSLAH